MTVRRASDDCLYSDATTAVNLLKNPLKQKEATGINMIVYCLSQFMKVQTNCNTVRHFLYRILRLIAGNGAFVYLKLFSADRQKK